MSSILNLLLVEDSVHDAELIVRRLELAGYVVESLRVQSERELSAALDGRVWDVLVADYAMPGFDGLSACRIVRDRDLDLPCILVSGVVGEEAAVAAMRAGVSDYVMKRDLSKLPAAVDRELRQAVGRRHRRAAEREARKQTLRYRRIFDSAPIALFEVDMSSFVEWATRAGVRPADPSEAKTRLLEARIRNANDAGLRLFGADERDALCKTLSTLLRDDEELFVRELLRALAQSRPTFQVEIAMHALSDATLDCLCSMSLEPADGDFSACVLGVLDLTEQKQLERRLDDAQRMETVGRVAAGVAHDFANVLTTLQSSSEVLLHAGDRFAEPAVYEEILVIRDALLQARTITSELLAFSRRQPKAPEVLDLNDVVRRMQRVLDALIEENVELVMNLDAGELLVNVHRGHLDQVLLNLVANARDAMPRGGSVTITTRLLEDENGRRRVRLTVRDSGEGMSPEVRARIFEPFYTTKRGKGGTGLGLATVHDLVVRDGGSIDVHSAPLQGTTLSVEWPAEAPALKTVNQSGIRPGAVRGGTVLVVEDDPMVRRSARRILANAGYRVLEAVDGEQALNVVREVGGGMDLVMTDMIMPKIAGADLAARIQKCAPSVAILCVSGYAITEFDPPSSSRIATLAKPFDSNELLAAVAELLTRDSGTVVAAERLG